MSTSERTPMDVLLQRVDKAGFSKSVARNALPSWWDDSMSGTKTGLTHGALFVARRLGIRVESLLDTEGPIVPTVVSKVCFKTNSTAEALNASTLFALSTARLIHPAVAIPFREDALPDSAGALRQTILRNNTAVTLDALMAWCWAVGIPVLHMSAMPGKRKPQALCLRYKGRPYIFLCDGRDFSAWQSFHLGHELGHICFGHLSEENSLCIDEDIDPKDTQEQEVMANNFAAELLLGDADMVVEAESKTTAFVIANKALMAGRERGIDPGSLILNAFYHDKQNAARYISAVKKLEPQPPAIERIRVEAGRCFNWQSLNEDDTEYLRLLLNLGETEAQVFE